MKYLLLTIVLSLFSVSVSAGDLPLPFSQRCDYFNEQLESLATKPSKIALKVFKIYWTTEAAEPIGITYIEWESYCQSLANSND